MIDPSDFAKLTEAAARLRSVALGDPNAVSPTVRLASLWACELLASVGAAPKQVSAATAFDVQPRLVEALELLGTVPLDVFGEHAVVEAAASARTALDATA